jgi:GrpB-like predicted nucleotidyltransferase (UPF0157 family)
MKNDTIAPRFGLNPGELHLIVVGHEWASRFSRERDRIASVLGPAAIDIQHVGSTAVPGMLAKPILDMAVAVESFKVGQSLVPVMEALGYEYRGEYGIPGRHYHVRGNPRRTHHLHMLERGGVEWNRHVRFRDRLLQSSELAGLYSELKRESLLKASGSRDMYQSLKRTFIANIGNQGACHDDS